MRGWPLFSVNSDLKHFSRRVKYSEFLFIVVSPDAPLSGVCVEIRDACGVRILDFQPIKRKRTRSKVSSRVDVEVKVGRATLLS